MSLAPRIVSAQNPCTEFVAFGPDTEFYVTFELSYEYAFIDEEDTCENATGWTLKPYFTWWEATATLANPSEFSLCSCNVWHDNVTPLVEDCQDQQYAWTDPGLTITHCPSFLNRESEWTMQVVDAPFPTGENLDLYEQTNTCEMAQWVDVPYTFSTIDLACPPDLDHPGEGLEICVRNSKCRITVIPSSYISCSDLDASGYFQLIAFDPVQHNNPRQAFNEEACCLMLAKAASCDSAELGYWLMQLVAVYGDYFHGEAPTLSDLFQWMLCAFDPSQLVLSESPTKDPGTRTGDGSGSACPNPLLTEQPVHVAYGDKWESFTDAAVPLAGGSFTIRRDYSSQHNYSGANLVGRNWTATPFWFIQEVESGENQVPWCNTPPVWDKVEYVQGLDQLYRPAGPTNLFLKSTTLTIDSVQYSVWRQTEPGAWEIDYLASGGQNVDAHEVGLMKQRRDMYGNSWTYNYTDFGASPPVARLTSIDCRSAANPANPDAQIRFFWNTSDRYGLDGTLTGIQIVRFTPAGVPIQTHMIEYLYQADEDPNQFTSTEVGTAGDLIQVIVRERVDGEGTGGEPADRVRITQYRYHDTSVTSRISSDGRLTVIGKDHQLKMIIGAEQIEAYAEEFGYTDVESAAAALLMLDDGDELGAPGSPKLIDLASKIVAYEESGSKVSRQYVQTGCGCSGSSGESQRFQYAYHDPQVGTLKTTQIDEYVGGSASVYRYHFYDWADLGETEAPTPYLMQYALVEPGASGDPDGRMWVTAYEYTALRETAFAMMPSAVSDYTIGTASTEADYVASTTSGLVYAYTYSDHRVQSQRLREGYDSDPANYTKIWDCDFDANRPWLVTELRRYRTESASPTADEIETTTFGYAFHSGDAIKWTSMASEAELAAENGPTGTGDVYSSAELFDTLGNNTWSLAADGALTKRIFDASGAYEPAGKVLSVTRNSDTTGLPSAINLPTLTNNDWDGRNSDGGSLTTTYAYDIAGRIRSITLPGDVTTYTYREMRPFAGRSTLDTYYAAVILPATNGSETNGPANVTWFNVDNDVIGRSDYAIDNIANYDPAAGDYSLGTQLSRAEVTHSLSGLVESTLDWWDTGHSPETTSIEYDDLGRVQFMTDANGTITEYHAYDVLDRVLEVRTGTDEQSMDTVAQFFYDWDHTGEPEQGQGDGNLTLTRLFTGEMSGMNPVVRDTEVHYDFRSRPMRTISPLPPHEIVEYDNLDRVLEQALFQIEPTDIDQDLTDRGLYVKREFSQRGLPYRESIAIDPTAVSPSFLESNRWYDPVGRPVVMWDPNWPVVKSDYDGMGRMKTRYVVHDGELYDHGPGRDGSPPIDNQGEVSGSIATDEVIEQMAYEYDRDASSPRRGTLDLVSTFHRLHDATGAGALTKDTAVPLYAGFYYDDFRRRIRSANFGVGDGYTSNEFEKGQNPPADWPPSTTPDYDSYFWNNFIIEATAYNARGLVDLQIDSLGKETKFAYDMMGRRVAVVENYDDTSGIAIAWSGTLDRWEVTDIGDEDDVNRVTSFVYDGVGNIRKQVAHLPETTDPNDSEVQETEYLYGVTTAGGSLLDSNSLLGAVHYPDETTGEAGTGRTYQVLYQYNRLGELLSVEDQNETIHTYSRDALGRVTLDAVTLAPGSDIDNWALSIGVQFDDFGRLQSVTSYTDVAGTTAKNQAEFAYSPLWQIEQIYQDYDGVVTYDGSGVPTGNTRRVQYAYDSAAVSAGNRSRLSTLTYPDGSVLDHHYGSQSSLDDDIARLTRMVLDGSQTDLVLYEHLGLGMIAAVDYATADVQLDRTVSHNGKRRTQAYQTQNAGVYPGWDRFGRVKKQAWVDGAYTTGLGSLPNLPPLIELDYTYDRTSNRLSMSDARPGATWVDRDFVYSYDGLDRLEQADRGADGGSWSSAVGGQKWALDMLGNWDTSWRDSDGDGAYESTEDQLRTHNAANEIEDLTPVTGPPALPFAYDDAGNMTESPNQTGTSTMYYTHDAWNRLTSVTVGTTPLGEYEYNALHWRTVKRSRNPVVGGPGLDEMRLMYYSANWQLLEERIDRSWSSGFTEDERAQIVWGKRYIDDAVLRRRDLDADDTYDEEFYYLSDAQFSAVAMVDSSNARVVERNTYEAYGKARHHFGGDVNNDGAASAADKNAILATMGSGNNSIGQGGYMVEQDLNRDGVIDSNDLLTLQALTGNSAQAALPNGQVSFNSTGSGTSLVHGPDNPIAWDGYVFNPETSQYTVRFRWYDPVLGRWLERDPIGFYGGATLYLYVDGQPIGQLDFIGLLGPDGKGGLNDWLFYAKEVLWGTATDIGGDACDLAVGAKRTIDFVVKESVIYVGTSLNLMDDEYLEESRIHRTLETARQDSPDSTTPVLVCKIGWGAANNWADGIATAVVEGDMHSLGDSFRNIGYLGLAGRAAPKAVGCLTGSTARVRCGISCVRYGSVAEMEAMGRTGLLRGGRPGRNYVTRDVYDTGLDAQHSLALERAPTRRARIEFDSKCSTCPPTRVKPQFGQPGGGTEFTVYGPGGIPIRIIKIDPLPLE
ncbi:MAG: hypothetical protein IT430_20395 [Phycisphaerales bacterium]|nr:hypothetical protein [Phycisphaerales bacterium]